MTQIIRACMPDLEWTVPLVPGVELTLSTKKHMGLLRRATRTKEVAIATRLAGRVPADGVLYDIGANIGLYTLVFAATRTRSVHSFEPGATALSFLRRNVEQNALQDVRIHAVALTDHAGTCRFVLDEVTTATSHVADASEPGVDVACADLDSYARDHRLPEPDLVKIDVEGHDMAVLRGMRGLLTRCRPLVWLEGGSRDKHGRSDSLAFLNGLGYVAWDLGQTREISADAWDYAYLAIAAGPL